MPKCRRFGDDREQRRLLPAMLRGARRERAADLAVHTVNLIPPAKPGGGKRRTDMRAVMDGVMYILSTGCQWRYLPKDFPSYSTVHRYFVWWQCDGVLDRIHHALYVACREKAEREATPTAAIIDSQSVKSAEKGGPASIRMATMRAKRSRARSATSS